MSNDEKLDLLLVNMKNMNEGIQELRADVGTLKSDVGTLKSDVGTLKSDVGTLKSDVGTLKSDVEILKNGLEETNERIKVIEMTIENETNKNICVIAEGHLNLDRKLDEALKSLQPNMMYQLKVNYLDNEVKKIKDVVGLK